MKNWYKFLSLLLLIGTIWAFDNVTLDFIKFYEVEGTLFKVQDCLIPNPVTTPCFYGAFGFLVAFIWSLKLNKMDVLKQHSHKKYLTIFLGLGTAFAWFNAGKDILEFYNLQNKSEGIVGCSGTLVSNPFTTPCFIGASIFAFSFLLSLILIIISKNKS